MRILKTGLFIGLAMLGSCKNETPIDDLPLVVHTLPENAVSVQLSAIVPEDDTFELFYSQDSTDNYGAEKSIRTALQGSGSIQQIYFVLPDSVRPTNMRIDPGDNRLQGKMQIEKLKINYYNDSLVISGQEFFNHFRASSHLKVDVAQGTANPVVQEGVDYDPNCYPNPVMVTALTKLTH